MLESNYKLVEEKQKEIQEFSDLLESLKREKENIQTNFQ